MENWEESPSGHCSGEESVDSGRNFSRGRGFRKGESSNPGNNDDGWNDDNDSWGSNTRGGKGSQSRRGFDSNGNGESCNSNDNDGDFEKRRGGNYDRNGSGDWKNDNGGDRSFHGGDRRGRGNNRGRPRGGGRGGNSFRRSDEDEWGNNNSSSDNNSWGGSSNRGKSRGGLSTKTFRSNDEDNWGEDNSAEDGGWGGSSNRGKGRGSRGGQRGGFRSNDGDDEWGGKDEGNSWGNESSRGRGRGGSRGGGRGGDDQDGQNRKPREIYVPPDPTEDETEMFGTAITSGINFDKYDDIPLEITGDDVVKTINSFEDSGLRQMLLDNIKKSGYLKPTPIQKAALPAIMAGRDVMACAQTGSGKTAAFLLPIINSLLIKSENMTIHGNHCEPLVAILSPTRELAIQIAAEARKFAHDSMLNTVVTYGGVSVEYQMNKIMNGCHILVATPGRMNDFVNREIIKFSSIRYVVLDEADRMLDMGFMPAIRQMLDHPTMVPTNERQTLMFSATFPEEIQRLAANFLNNYLFITVGIIGGACSDVQQLFYEIDKYKKREKLLELLNENGAARTLVFVETKRNADFIATYLSENSIRTTSIHGDRLQKEREDALRDFRTGNRDVLVATDVAARGLDIKNVKHVINYDLPKSIDEYVHRIGRTGRVGNRGNATSFFDCSQDGPLAPNLIRILTQANQNIPDWLKSAASGASGSYTSGRFGGRDVRDDSFAMAKDFYAGDVEQKIEEW